MLAGRALLYSRRLDAWPYYSIVGCVGHIQSNRKHALETLQRALVVVAGSSRSELHASVTACACNSIPAGGGRENIEIVAWKKLGKAAKVLRMDASKRKQ